MAEKILYFRYRSAWRAWLKKNHASSKGAWLVYYKKHTGKQSISYPEALEEALCFGWIDSRVKRIDGEKYMQRFTPRKKNSLWSKINRKAAEKLVKADRMTKAGLAKIEEARQSGRWREAYGFSEPATRKKAVPPDLRKALDANPKAKKNFETMAPSYRVTYAWWVGHAKRQETREKRVKTVVRRLAENKKPRDA